MASRKRGNDRDATGFTVAKNVRRVRLLRDMTQEDLAAALEQLGRSIPLASVGRIESGHRAVEVDDLMALAVALEVSPLGLLLPVEAELGEPVDVTGWAVDSEELWLWVTGRHREDPPGTHLPHWLNLSPTVNMLSTRALAAREAWKERNG